MTTIILNPEAVNALFPEGSEARVELQRSVLQQLVKQYIKQPDLNAEVTKYLGIARQSAVDEVLKTLGGVQRTAYGYSTQLSDAFKKEIGTTVRVEIQAHVRAMVDQALTDSSLQSRVGSYLDPAVKTAVTKAISDSLAGLGTLAALVGKGA